MRLLLGVLILILALAAAMPLIAASDPLCALPEAPPLPVPEPLSAASIVDLMLGTMVRNGIAVLFLGALVVVGAPWIMAGLAVVLLHLPRR